jgi:octaprenyl-diphosphate synthase
MMVEIGDMKVMQILSHATNTIAEGEVQQLTNIRNPHITEADYLQVISRKTAMLFEAASHSGAVLAHGTLEQQTALQAYGLHLGRAFQLVDDVLDYKGTADDMGKNIGDDLAEGKATLPLIVAMRDGEPDQADFVRQAILNGGVENLDRIAQIVEAAGGLKYTSELAVRETTAAIESLAALPDSPYKTAMLNLAEFSISRNH